MVYSASFEPVLAGAGMVLFHTVTGGERTIVLKNGKRVKMNLKPHTVVLLDAVTGKKLLK